MEYVDMETGEVVQCQAFVATLPASDYGYALFVRSQRTEDFIYAITQCLKHLGGVLDRLVHTSVRFELSGCSLRQKKRSSCSITDENQ